MSTALDRFARRPSRKALTITSTVDPERQSWQLGQSYGAYGPTWTGDENALDDFEVFVEQAYRAAPVVFSCILARQMVLSEATFQFRRWSGGRPGELFGDPALALLEKPWVNGTTGDLLTRMESDGSLAGNSFTTKVDDQGRIGNLAGGRGLRVARLRPDYVTLVIGVPGRVDDANPPNVWDVRARVLGFLYRPSPLHGSQSWYAPRSQLGTTDEGEVLLLPEEVAHFAPIPDPLYRFRGMSWLTPVIREIEADKAATQHKRKFFLRGASPSMSVSFDKDISSTAFEKFVASFKASHGGADNSYKPLFLVGADVKPMTFDMRQLDMKAVQGAGETRIASAARVPPIIAGLSEGLDAATYSNYSQAKRHFADGTIRPLWRMMAAALQTLVERGDGAQLWYDDREISFLREDLLDSAEIQGKEASTIRQLLDGGFEAGSVVAAVRANDFSLLKHSGMFSVQLQAPGAQAPPADQALPPGVRRLPPAIGASSNG